MAAAPAEVPTPLATTDLPPAKRKKKDPSCLEISPVVPAAAAGGWSSLPDDLVRRIADSFLATNDLDHYVNLRAICPSWRAATDDPRKDTSDVRFHPQTWIVLDEVFQSDDRRIMLNTATGRFLRKKLPLLRDYYVVATTSGGFFVLADRSPPHAARVLNPLTGHMVPFAVHVPPEVGVAYFGSFDMLVLLGDSSRKLYKAFPESKDFYIDEESSEADYNFYRKVVVGGAYTHVDDLALCRAFVPLLRAYHARPTKCFSSDFPGDGNDLRCFLVGLAGEVLVVMIAYGRPLFPVVFKMNTEIGEPVPVQSVGRNSIFIGHHKCLPLDADKFPGIEANCVYYTEHLGSSAHICKYNIRDKKVERISEAAEFVKQGKQFVLVADRPFTIIQLLCSYTINIPDSQLALQQMS